MSLLTHEGRITVKAFAAVPTLANLPEIQQAPGSVANISSFRGTGGGVDLAEGCILTKSVKYTHQLAHWVNAVRSGDPSEVERVIEFQLQIIPYREFGLDDPCNLAYLEAFVRTSLDLYAFIAITASSSTLSNLINMVKADNSRRQRHMDDSGFDTARILNFSSPSFTNPEFELVAIHPEHFLPCGSVLPVCHPNTSTPKIYVPASDRRLRESPEPDSPSLPAFRHLTTSRNALEHLNIFLVILNAEIKFHRYLRMISQNPPTTSLPADVLALMHLTIELVDILYWKPVPTKGSRGEALLAKRVNTSRKNPPRTMRPDSAKTMERGSSEEREMMGDDEVDNRSRSRSNSGHHRKFCWTADTDIETRKAYGRALMSGHDRYYDPALFENAIPINDSTNLFSEKVNMEAWQQSINRET